MSTSYQRISLGDSTDGVLLRCRATNHDMYPTGNLFIPVQHGQLEAVLKEVPAARGVALVLHPHPLGGGTMHNKVVFRAAQALNEAGLTTLRINFRGVGQSTGEYDEGRGEVEDVRAALRYLQEHYDDNNIVLAGFSFGSRVGMEVGITDPRVTRLLSIGTPVDKYDFSFLENCRKPILFVHGERDEFGGVEKLRSLVNKLAAHTDAELVLIKGADHFFEGHLDELKHAITNWITKAFPQTTPEN